MSRILVLCIVGIILTLVFIVAGETGLYNAHLRAQMGHGQSSPKGTLHQYNLPADQIWSITADSSGRAFFRKHCPDCYQGPEILPPACVTFVVPCPDSSMVGEKYDVFTVNSTPKLPKIEGGPWSFKFKESMGKDYHGKELKEIWSITVEGPENGDFYLGTPAKNWNSGKLNRTNSQKKREWKFELFYNDPDERKATSPITPQSSSGCWVETDCPSR